MALLMDNSSKHKADSTLEWLADNEVPYMENWRAIFPDFMEND